MLGRQTDDDKKEHFDDGASLEKKLDQLSEWIRNSKHCILFTGAGISTSCGIPDYRSGLNTVLKTGPGSWELRDNNMSRDKKNTQVVSTLQAIPSQTHMSIVKLQCMGFVKFVVSQNTDGLHLRSGLEADSLAELHGNTNLEICNECKSSYLRDFRTRNARHVFDHKTGRKCVKCGGDLMDSIVNFGENLPEEALERAYSHAESADLCICLGSSLTVSPANNIPNLVSQHGKLVICNLQKTPLHENCHLPIHAMCDTITKGILNRLGFEAESWKLKRRVRVTANSDYVCVTGLDLNNDVPYSLFSRVELCTSAGLCTGQLLTEPFNFKKPCEFDLMKLHFHGHYKEPEVALSVKYREHHTKDFILVFDLDTKTWKVS